MPRSRSSSSLSAWRQDGSTAVPRRRTTAPQIAPSCLEGLAPGGGADHQSDMRIAIGLYERFTSLDALGPFQVLSSLPGAEVAFVAAKAGPVTDESGFLEVRAHASFDELPNPDVLLVPGGIITGTLVPHHPIVGWIARAHATTTWKRRCAPAPSCWPAPACAAAWTRPPTGARSTTSPGSAPIPSTNVSCAPAR